MSPSSASRPSSSSSPYSVNNNGNGANDGALSDDCWSTVARLGEAWAAVEAATTSSGAATTPSGKSHLPRDERHGPRRIPAPRRHRRDDVTTPTTTTTMTTSNGFLADGVDDDGVTRGASAASNAGAAAMRDKIRSIMDRRTDATDDPAPLVLFALRYQRREDTAAALDALEAVRALKAGDVETICTTHYGNFTRAMGELECIRDGMAALGRRAAAQNDELQAAGRPLVECFEELRDGVEVQRRVGRAADAVAKCQAALEVAAAAREVGAGEGGFPGSHPYSSFTRLLVDSLTH